MSDLFGTEPRLPVITLWQPWASLVFIGDKKHETRSFAPPAKYMGQRIAIHAAKALPSVVPMGVHLLCERQWGAGERWREAVHRGVILGTVRLVGCVRTDEGEPVDSVDQASGDWSPGRFAWRLIEPERLLVPVPARGKQGWWSIQAAALRTAA